LANREITVINQVLSDSFTKNNIGKGVAFMVLIGIVIGFLSPFGMSQVPLITSMSFWVITCVIGYLIYAPFIHLSNRLLKHKVSQGWLRVAIAVLIAGLVMSFLIPLLSRLFFTLENDYMSQVIKAFSQSFIIGSIITVVSMMKQLIYKQQEQLVKSQTLIDEQARHTANVDDVQLNVLMHKLPLEKRGTLLCLEMDDHYLKVYTSKGHHLILMRFKDALTLLAAFDGLQTHRSWWVAQSAVVGVERDGRKTFLRLSNELLVPVSRTYLKNLTLNNLS